MTPFYSINSLFTQRVFNTVCIAALLLFGLISLSGCGGEESIDPVDSEDTIDPPASQTACEFDLSNTIEGEELLIDCKIDLNGSTITFPKNVLIQFGEGGELINGKLIFSENGKIASQFLNLSLEIEGPVLLIEPVVNFIQEKWEVVAGEVNDETALKNKENLQKAIDLSKRLGASEFKIDQLSAYFKTDVTGQGNRGLTAYALHLPSDFQLSMTENTFLRVQPFDTPYGILLSIFEQKNVQVSGGNLIGDRYQHDYKPFTDAHGISRNTHEWPSLITIAGSENVIVDGTNLMASTGDCLVVGAVGDENGRTNPDALWNKNVIIRNCTTSEGRRNNITVTDGEGIIIENNDIIDAGIGEVLKDDNGNIIYNSSGTFPKFGLDVEPFVFFSNFRFDSRIQFEWVENLIIKGNRFRGNHLGSIILFAGDQVTIEDNFSDHTISQNTTIGSKIINNTLEAREDLQGVTGITTSDFRRYTDRNGGNLQEYAIGNDVIGNVVNGFTTGIRIRGGQSQVSENQISNFSAGLIVEKAENADIFENTYRSDDRNSTALIYGTYSNKVSIHDEDIDVEGRYVFINGYNRMIPNLTNDIESYTSEIRNCTIKAKRSSSIRNAIGLHLISNTIDTGLEIVGSDRIRFENNMVNATGKAVDGVIIDQSINSRITDNTFVLDAGFDKVIIMNEPSNSNNVISGNE